VLPEVAGRREGGTDAHASPAIPGLVGSPLRRLCRTVADLARRPPSGVAGL